MKSIYTDYAHNEIVLAHGHMNEAAQRLKQGEIEAADEFIRCAINSLSRSRGQLIQHRSPKNKREDT